jgi:hypothetical protein
LSLLLQFPTFPQNRGFIFPDRSLSGGGTAGSSGLKLVLKRPAPDLASEDSTSSDSGEGVVDGGKPTAKTPRRKRRFRLTDSIAKAKRRAERRAQVPGDNYIPPIFMIPLFSGCPTRRGQPRVGGAVGGRRARALVPPEAPKLSIRSYDSMQLLADFLFRKLLLKDPEEYFAYAVTP